MFNLSKGNKRYGSAITDEQILAIAKQMAIDFNAISPKEFVLGYRSELEHIDVTGGDPVDTAKIALAHLREMPDYYTKLKKMEV